MILKKIDKVDVRGEKEKEGIEGEARRKKGQGTGERRGETYARTRSGGVHDAALQCGGGASACK